MSKKKSIESHLRIPAEVELFGRKIVTMDDTERLELQRNYGQARYGVNHIAVSKTINGSQVSEDELKLTYLHEMLHFILNFTGYESVIHQNKKIDLEQFVELLASGIYQYEKTAKY